MIRGRGAYGASEGSQPDRPRDPRESGGHDTAICTCSERVMGYAQARQLLASGTVKDLVAGSGLTFDDRGAREGVKQTSALPELWRRSGGHRTRPIALRAAVGGFAVGA